MFTHITQGINRLAALGWAVFELLLNILKGHWHECKSNKEIERLSKPMSSRYDEGRDKVPWLAQVVYPHNLK